MTDKRDWDDPQYKAWRQEVRKRDHYSCQMPGCNSKRRLQVHHIASWSQNPSLRFEPANGITLCRDHHEQVNKNEELYAPLFRRIVDAKQRPAKGNSTPDSNTRKPCKKKGPCPASPEKLLIDRIFRRAKKKDDG